MSSLQIALIGIVLVLLLAWLWLRQRARGPGASGRAAERIDTLIGWPPQATRVLGKADLVTLGTLTKALPEYLVLAQVPLSRFINVPKRNSYADWLRRVGYQSIDFLVCDLSGQVVAVVELQPLQMSERARKRHDRIARTLEAAQIPLHVWRSTGLPSPEAAREALLPRLATQPEHPGVAPSFATAVAPPSAKPASPEKAAATTNPFADTNRDSSHDEKIELLEPPPSTWFDDMDSDPVPLSKR